MNGPVPNFLSDEVWKFLKAEFGNEAVAWAILFGFLFRVRIRPSGQQHKNIKGDVEKLNVVSRNLARASQNIDDMRGGISITLSMNLLRKESSVELWHEKLSTLAKEVDDSIAELKKSQKALAPTGGRDPMAILLAEQIAEVFTVVGEPVTFGQSYLGEPSTRYSRTVCFLLQYFGHEIHWRRVAEAGFHYAKRRAKEPKS